MENMNLLTDMQQIMCQAMGWTLIVCASLSDTLICRRYLSTYTENDVHFSGRTAVWPSGKRISVVWASGDNPVPDGTPFSVAFVGWRSQDDYREMGKWNKKAQKVMSLT